MTRKRWFRIIPAALIMYTISYVDRTNISLALDGRISSMARDLGMDERMKGMAAGVFFFGYFLLQAPGGYIAQRWSPRGMISVCLVAWGVSAMACGLVHSYWQFAAARFCLGLAESSVFPTTMIILTGWFPHSERVRASALWCVCQPLAVVASAPATGWCLQAYGWRTMLVAEGALPILFLPFWLYFIADHPRQAKWLPAEERDFLEASVNREIASLEPTNPVPLRRILFRREVLLMMTICILYCSTAYGAMTFFTSGLRQRHFTGTQYGLLFALPYLLSMIVMLWNSAHSDRTGERKGHVAWALAMSGASLVLSVVAQNHFWVSYAFMCLAIPGPFAVLGPFFAIPAETFPRGALGPLLGSVNSVGNLGGFAGPFFVGWLADIYHSVSVPFVFLGLGTLAAGGLALLLPTTKRTWD